MIKAHEEKTLEQKKREMGEDLEYLKEVDKSTGREYVKMVEDEKVKKTKDDRDVAMNYIDHANGVVYRMRIVEHFNKIIPKLDLPRGWEAEFIATEARGHKWIYGKSIDTQEGVILVLKAPRPKEDVYIVAVKLTYNPQMDFKNMGTLLTRAENTVDSVRGALLSDKDTGPTEVKTPGGIILPYGNR